MTQSYEAILFDFGGVLTGSYREAGYFDELAGKFGIEKSQLQSYLQDTGRMAMMSLGQIDESTFVSGVRATFPEAAELEPLAVTSDHFYPHPDTLEAVRQLRAHSAAKLCVASNIFPASAAYLREVEGFGDRFDRLYFSCELGKRKPDANYFEHILNDLDVDPENVVFLDDLPHYLAGAEAVGINTIHVADSSQTIDIIRSFY